MFKTFKVKLHPNNKQETVLRRYAGAARFAYNWAIEKEEQRHEDGLPFLQDTALRREFTELKKQPGYGWLNNIDCNVTKQAIKDAVAAYKAFFKGNTGHPRYKSRSCSKPSFYQDPVKLQVSDRRVKLALVAGTGKAGSRRAKLFDRVKLAEKGRIPKGVKYYNPRVSYDGLDWWVCVSVEVPDPVPGQPASDGIGVDLGVKTLAVCSDGTEVPNIDKSRKLKKLQERRLHIQKSISRKYEKNKKGGRYRKTKNIMKSEKLLQRTYKHMKCLRDDHVQQAVRSILSRKPTFIGLENLNVSGMLKNHRLAKAVQGASFKSFREKMSHNAAKAGIPVIIIDRWDPSSKACSRCGHVKQVLALGERVYECPSCGLKIDRDLNASINIRECARKGLMEPDMALTAATI